MRRYLPLFLSLVCLAAEVLAQPTPPEPLTKEQQEQLKERDWLWKEAHKLRSEDKLAEAAAVVEKIVATGRKVRGDTHDEVAFALEYLAGLHEALEDFAAARKARQEVLAIRTTVLGAGHWQTTDARLALANVDVMARLTPEQRGRLKQANKLNDQLVALGNQGKHAEGVPLAVKVLETRIEILGAEHSSTLISMNNLGWLYRESQQEAKAELVLTQMLQLRKKVLGAGHPTYAHSFNVLGWLHIRRQQLDGAEQCFKQAQAIYRDAVGDKSHDYALTITNLAALYYGSYNHAHRGDFARAEPLYLEALEIYRRNLGDKHPSTLYQLQTLGSMYRVNGELAKAETLLREVQATRRQTLGEKHLHYGGILYELAAVYREKGDFGKAEPLYLAALAITRAALGHDHPQTAPIMGSMGRMYRLMGDLPHAEQYLQAALAIGRRTVKEAPQGYAHGLQGAGLLYRAMGDYARAEPLFREAVAVSKQWMGEKHPDYARFLCGLAEVYAEMDDPARAEPLFGQALPVARQALGERNPHYAQSLHSLAMLHVRQGDYARAEPVLRQAIDAVRAFSTAGKINPDRLTPPDLMPVPITVSILHHHAQVLRLRAGQSPTAAQLRASDSAYALAAALLDRLRSEALEHEDSKTFHGDDAFDLFPERLGVLRELFALEEKRADLEAAFTAAEAGTARVFLEQLSKSRAEAIGQVSAELRQQEADLRRGLRQLATRIAQEQNRPPDKRNADLVGQLFEEQKQLEIRLQQLIERMEKEYPQYAALKYPRPCTLAEARSCLAANELALLFVPGRATSYAIVVEARSTADQRTNGLAIFPLPGADALAELTAALTDPDTLALPARTRSLGSEGYRLLLAPLRDKIKGRDLVIVPGGPLCHLPFELLIEDGKYLIENRRIRYAPSLTALHMIRLWEKTRAKPDESLWALGDPVYDAADARLTGKPPVAVASLDATREVSLREGRAIPFRRLHYSGQEVRALSVLMQAPVVNRLTGLDASEARVKEASASGALARARYVHFATHGILGLDIGQQPALVLSLVGNDGKQDDSGINDGFLRLDEVTHLKLNADLVVLSACRSGQGRLHNGEGVSGLARAFLYAGSRGVICSMWSVDDQLTAQLMTATYQRLKDGQASADALRQAKLAAIRAGTAPLYWAPFILIGE